jgi:hypothetical protein
VGEWDENLAAEASYQDAEGRCDQQHRSQGDQVKIGQIAYAGGDPHLVAQRTDDVVAGQEAKEVSSGQERGALLTRA